MVLIPEQFFYTGHSSHIKYCKRLFRDLAIFLKKKMTAPFYGKQYKLDSSDKFDEFMKAIGVGLVTRKMGNAVSPIIELSERNGELTLKSMSTFKNTTITFKLGQEFDEETPDGRKVKSVITQVGNVLHQIQKGDKVVNISREFTPEQVKMVLKVDDIVCTRIYKVVD